jgi:two-component system response regulator (stage 0 sporulation protein F)
MSDCKSWVPAVGGCYNPHPMTSAGLGRILIVDDEASVREVLCEYFVEQGYSVATASSGDEALGLVQQGAPDLVLLDVRMPGLDGVETLRRMRMLVPGLPVIMVTANEDVGLARETLKLGALDYVAKPFDFDYLERAIQAGLAAPAGDAAAGAVDPWHALALAIFRAVRGMTGAGRESTGTRLEAAALAAAREAATGGGEAAAAALGELELLLGLATELGDLSAAALAEAGDALAAARRARR